MCIVTYLFYLLSNIKTFLLHTFLWFSLCETFLKMQLMLYWTKILRNEIWCIVPYVQCIVYFGKSEVIICLLNILLKREDKCFIIFSVIYIYLFKWKYSTGVNAIFESFILKHVKLLLYFINVFVTLPMKMRK